MGGRLCGCALMNMQDSKAAYRKIVKARTGLVLEHPFFGALTLGMRLREDTTCETAWSEGKTLAYNPLYVNMLPHAKLKGLMGHVVMHPACRHHLRRNGRNHKQWNMACDYAINWILLEAGLTLPDGYLDKPAWRGKTADEIYTLLSPDGSDNGREQQARHSEEKKTAEEQPSDPADPESKIGREQTQSDRKDSDNSTDQKKPRYAQEARKDDDHRFEQGDPGKAGEVRDAPPPEGGSAAGDDPAEMENEIKIALARAAQQARAMGDLPAGLARLIDRILSPKLDWQSLLSRFINAAVRHDYAWTPPNRRYLHQGLYLPTMRSNDLPEVVVAVDTSGSVSPAELDQFAAELSAILEYGATTVHLLYCDMQVVRAETVQRQDLPLKLVPKGGGGTDFRPTFDWVAKQTVLPCCLIYLTDLECNRFPEMPTYPVLWARIGDSNIQPPFGEVVDIR